MTISRDAPQENQRPNATRSARSDRGSGAAGAAAAAGAGGAGLGAGAAAGIVGGDEAAEFIRERTGDGDDSSGDLDAVRDRVAAAEDAARDATFDVFESRVADAGAAVPAGIAEAAGIIGDALPPVPRSAR